MGALVSSALACGARRSELLALRWCDVDLNEGTLTIRGALSETRAGVVEKVTKTDKIRPIALSPDAAEALRRQRSLQAQDRLACGGAFADSGHVFQTQMGGSERPSRATECCRKLARQVAIPAAKMQALRHTTGSWLIASGVDPQTVASILGHSSATVTLGVYSHLVVGMQKAAVVRIDERLSSKAADGKGR